MRTTYSIATEQITVCNSRGQHEYLLIYRFKLKSVVDACQGFSRSLCFVAKRIHPTAKISEEVNRKYCLWKTTYNLQRLHRP